MNRYRVRNRQPRAYRPRPPFHIIEGSGTPPFNRLCPPAVWVLHRLYAKSNGFNRNNLSFTYDEASEIICERVFTRSLWELRAFGFIEVVRQGRLERTCTIYALSNRWRRFDKPGDPATEDELNRIQETLEKIESLKREIWPAERKSEKRQRINVLRRSLIEE